MRVYVRVHLHGTLEQISDIHQAVKDACLIRQCKAILSCLNITTTYYRNKTWEAVVFKCCFSASRTLHFR